MTRFRSPLAMLRAMDAQDPDSLLLDLYDAGASAIRLDAEPRRGGHGRYTLTWAAHGRREEVQASTLRLALQRAVAHAQARLRAHQEGTP